MDAANPATAAATAKASTPEAGLVATATATATALGPVATATATAAALEPEATAAMVRHGTTTQSTVPGAVWDHIVWYHAIMQVGTTHYGTR